MGVSHIVLHYNRRSCVPLFRPHSVQRNQVDFSSLNYFNLPLPYYFLLTIAHMLSYTSTISIPNFRITASVKLFSFSPEVEFYLYFCHRLLHACPLCNSIFLQPFCTSSLIASIRYGSLYRIPSIISSTNSSSASDILANRSISSIALSQILL